MNQGFKRTAACLLAALLLTGAAAFTVQALEPSGNGVKVRNWLTNDPDYEFSDAYKTSVWYDNFTSLTLTENQRNNVLRVAVSQLGYHEGDSEKDFNGKNRGGSDNYIEYARLLVPNYNDNHYEWCACFVNWCLNQARIDYAYGEIGCWKWVEWLKANKMFESSAAYGGDYTPSPADMIFFNWDGNNRTSGHIGYVLYVTDDRIYTIEGNSQNEVGIRNYAIDDPCVIGFGTPPYEEGNEPTIDFSCADGLPRGLYIFHDTTAAITDGPGSRKRVKKLSPGACVTVLDADGEYAHVTYEDKEGYLPVSAICLMTLGCTATFKADGKIVAELPFHPATKTLTPPEVPARAGYTGAWEPFELNGADFTVNAVYTLNEYTVTFIADGETVSSAAYSIENMRVTIPPVPEKEGFTGEWPDFSLDLSDVTVEAVYPAVTEAPTEAPTDAPTEADTPAGTDLPTGEASDGGTDTKADAEGCVSSVSGLVPLLASAAAALFGRKRRD